MWAFSLSSAFFFSYYSAILGCLAGHYARRKKLPGRLVHSWAVWAVDLNPVSSVPMVRGQGFLGNGETEADTLRITSLHSSEYWFSYELTSWHGSEGRTSVGTRGWHHVMQVCHAVSSCDKQGGGRVFGKQSCQQAEKFICPSFLWRGYINPPKSACFLTYTTTMSRDISTISVCFRVMCVLQSECLQNSQATLDGINDLYVQLSMNSQCFHSAWKRGGYMETS